MFAPLADIPPEYHRGVADTSQENGRDEPGAHLPATIALGASAALLAFLILLAPIHAAVPTVPLPEPLLPHHQTAETLLYGLAFLVLMPLSVLCAQLLVSRVLAGANPGLAGPLSALTVAGAGATIIIVRLIGASGQRLWLLAGLSLLVAVLAGLLWWRAAGSKWATAGHLEANTFELALLAGLTTAGAVASFSYLSHIDLPWLLAGLVLTGVVLFAFNRFTMPRLTGGWGLALDLVIVILVIAAVPDMVVFHGVGEGGSETDAFITYVINFHQALYLGAASQILNGAALLVDTVSQYGVASIYLLAAFFKVAPIGNGTLAFFDASLTALTFGAGYAILRMAGVARLLATATMLVALVVLIWALEYPIGGLLQHGGLRFGLPVPLILFWVAAARYPRARRWFRAAGWAVVGLSIVWALEAFMYVSGALAGMLLIEAALLPAGRLRWLTRQVLYALVAWVVALIVFAVATLVWGGALPDWGLYLTYLRDFLAGDVGDLTYDVPDWSPGLTVGFAYLVAAIALAVTAIRKPDWLRARPVAAVALAGLAGYGILLYSYFDNRSLPHVIPYISLPLVLSVALWLWLVINDRAVPRRAATAALGLVMAVAALSVSSVMPNAADRAGTSMLAYALPGENSLSDGFERLWNPPELKAGATDGAALLDRYMPGQEASPVLTVPDLDNNILTLAGRANSLAITDAKEQSWVEGPHLEPVAEAVDGLEPGDLMLIDTSALAAYRKLAFDPQADREELAAETTLADIQLIALRDISEQYRLRPVAREGSLLVVELLSR